MVLRHLRLTAMMLALSAGVQAVQPATAESVRPILDSAGFWRGHFTYRQPIVQMDAGPTTRPTITGDTAPPPGDWMKADFDDAHWPRMPGYLFPAGGYNRPIELRNAGFNDQEFAAATLGLIALRGKFAVTDPSTVADLKLRLEYRGGVVAYLNGQELGRSHVSGPGAEALADIYPAEAYVTAEGSILGGQYFTRKFDEETLRRLGLRRRTYELAIPANKLRKGVNVLALEIHRAPHRAEMIDKTRKIEFYQIPMVLWSTCNLLTVRLEAAGEGIVPNVARPKGVQVWNSPIITPDFDLDWGDPHEPLGPVRLVGPRGGSVSGKVVVGSDQPLVGLKASLSELTGKAGQTIAASAVKIRYGVANGWEQVPPGSYTHQPTPFDGLADRSPAEVPVSKKPAIPDWFILPGQIPSSQGAVVPVFVTVEVPAQTAPGLYQAELTISQSGMASGPVKVPVELRVGAWKCPPPAQFDTVMDLIQSADSVAMQYQVPLWSPEHFRYLEESFQRAAYVGNWTLYLPLIAKTNLGNEESMVRWVGPPPPESTTTAPTAAPAGGWKFDYTVLEKYLDTAIVHMGKPRIVVLYVWDMHLGGTKTYHQDSAKYGGVALTGGEVPVTRQDGQTGKASSLLLPPYGADTMADWKRLAAGVMERLRQRGLEKSAMIGMGSDGRPTPEQIEFLAQVWDHLPWARGGHYEWQALGNSREAVGYQANVWPYKFMEDPAKGLYSMYGWSRPVNRALFVRTYEPSYTVLHNRLFPEMSIVGAQRGLGRIGLDFWPVLKSVRPDQPHDIHGRYPDSNWRQLDAMVKAEVAAGPDGAMAGARLESLREGLQEAQARIVIERALKDESARARLGPDLAARCRKALDDRVRAYLPLCEHQESAGAQVRDYGVILNGWDNYALVGLRSLLFHRYYQQGDWQGRLETLFDLAAQVEAKVSPPH